MIPFCEMRAGFPQAEPLGYGGVCQKAKCAEHRSNEASMEFLRQSGSCPIGHRNGRHGLDVFVQIKQSVFVGNDDDKCNLGREHAVYAE